MDVWVDGCKDVCMCVYVWMECGWMCVCVCMDEMWMDVCTSGCICVYVYVWMK